MKTGYLEQGFAFDDLQATFLPHHQLFSRRPYPPRQAPPARPVVREDLLEFTPGDTVVHANRGIAVYRGMTQGSGQGVEKEYLRLEFRDRAHLLVPLENAHLLRRYIGVGSTEPSLSLLSGKDWRLRKAKVRDAVTELAMDLLELQASRSARPGIAFPPDSAWQAEFENSFPFEETPDQLTAAVEIKADMESPRPMDRLICGDVGYGKTELAMRAAFKAVSAGRQAAVLVPTTLLAQQHHDSFTARFAGYPFFVEMISRFRTPRETREILERTSRGEVDILIGTHRLVQPDVEFRDLGLVVIDEEQRFGVRHKEHLKRLRARVDVLTLTATPIPRTLHMSLLGLRDISNLTTPPPGRLAIDTRIIRFDPSRVARAVRAELDREGQIYFVHDRVQSIPGCQRMLEAAVPEATIGTVHGQLKKSALKACMDRFLAGDIQILLTTTIIESGVDIPNVNTIFINNAHNFGLADLHQLRGRVGRFNRKAFAYLILPERLPLREIAEKRVRAIEEYSELGAGFKIALRDLEIRGAGNIIGKDQSGHITQVGYNMYCRLLREAASQLKTPGRLPRTEVSSDLPVDTRVPREYTGSLKLTIWLHRSLSSAETNEALDEVLEQARDRFGPPPEEVVHLSRLARVKLAAGETGVLSLVAGDPGVFAEFDSPDRAKSFLGRSGLPKTRATLYDERVVLLKPPPDCAIASNLVGFLEKVFSSSSLSRSSRGSGRPSRK